MRLLLFVFSCYLLVLACLPCQCDSDQATQTLRQETIDTKHSEAENPADHCSPFCSCSCCLSVALDYHRESLAELPLFFYLSLQSRAADQHIISHNVHAIWQPPKLS